MPDVQIIVDTVIKSLSITERRKVDKAVLQNFIEKRMEETGDEEHTILLLSGLTFARSQAARRV